MDWLSREQIEKHSLDMRQFMDFRQSTLPNGMRIIEAYNGSGLTFTVLPDRGFDIWTAHYNGLPLTWISQGSPFLPDMSQPWLRQFNGGLLTTCGLRHSGPPETDPDSGEVRDLHGLISRLRAYDVSVQGGWQGDEYVLELRGVVAETQMFSEQLKLTRVYRLTLGAPVIEIVDQVANLGDQPAPLMVLYHVNPGFPLVSEGAVLHTPYERVYSRDEAARPGFDRWPYYDAPTPRYAEQVFFHHVKVDDSGRTRAALVHPTFGFQLEWDTGTLPYFTQWKNTREGIYVCGVEPGNCLPEGQISARESGRLVTLEPGATQQFELTLAVLDGADAVQQSRDQIDELRINGAPAAGCDFAGYTS